MESANKEKGAYMSLEHVFPFAAGPMFPPTDELRDLRVVRTRPRTSLHSLAHYLDASPTKRRQIIVSEKYPSPYRVSYWPAKRLFREALRLGWDEETLFSVASDRWFSEPAESELADFRRRQAMDAVAEFCELLEPLKKTLDDAGATVRLSGRLWRPLNLGGVMVADSPSLVLRRLGAGNDQVGVLTFHVAKTKAHSLDSAKRAAALLVALAAENKTAATSLAPELCFVVDVHSGLIVDGNRGNSRRLKRAEHACREISAMWDRL